MTSLEKVLESLKLISEKEEYRIPQVWNYVDCVYEKSETNNEIIVDAKEFFTESIKFILSKNEKQSDDLVIYSMLMRTFSAWDHGCCGLENGNLLKTMCLLPIIKKMGFNAIYLLPVFETSKQNMKGEVPSPYCVKDIMKIDSSLTDRHIPQLDSDMLFEAFCQSAHNLGMKVIVDFVFRTTARDSVLINEHPEWFYWIKTSCEEDFSAPKCPQLPHTGVNKKNVSILYQSPEMRDFANCFAHPPKKESFENKDILKEAREKLGITIMPGFADTINDPQPAWTDITFFRFYKDNTKYAIKKYGNDFPPMIAQDGVKCSVFEGEEKNEELFRYIEDVIPYYIERFSIDGARIDMAHALPGEVAGKMMKKIKDKRKDFALWSEEFHTDKSGEAKEAGYTFFTGGIWDLWDKNSYESDDFNKRIAECIGGKLPCVSCVEMPDTPRCAQKLGIERTITTLFITALLPNSVLFVNNALELGEKQPMNLGLKSTEKDRFVLPKNHKYYGKLAFFDNYCFDWTNRKHIYNALVKSIKIRKKYYNVIKKKENYNIRQLKNYTDLTVINAFDNKKGFIALINRGKEEMKIYLKKLIPENAVLGECIYGNENRDTLYPDTVTIYEIKQK